MQDQILQPVIAYMEKKGATEDEIANAIADLIQAATIMLYQQAMETFSDEDLQKIEAAPDDETANKLIVELYAQRVGTPASELLNVFLQEFVNNFLTEQQ